MRRRDVKARRDALQAALRRAREDAGFTQTELAKKLGRPQSFVSKYETGERRLDVIEVEDICEILGVPISRLVKKGRSYGP